MRFSRKLATTAVAVLSLAGLAIPAAEATPSDTDGDKILDVWETEGYDFNGDGTIDIDFPALGANPYQKDLFVEMDYMPGELATEAELDVIVQTFADMPVKNPDGTTGINLHLDAGSIYPKYDLGGGNEIPHQGLAEGAYDAWLLRGEHSDPAREPIFHYMIWGDYYGDTASSGQGYYDWRVFIVTVGDTYWGEASSSIRIGVFIHELGHNLGLGHGGADEVNYKPNYMSVMNYLYTLDGIKKTDGTTSFGYSYRAITTLNEKVVMETKGLSKKAQGFFATVNGQQWVADQGIDFNGDGTITHKPQTIDVNGDGVIGKLTAPNDLDLLDFQVEPHPLGSSTEVSQAPQPRQPGALPELVSNELTAEVARDLGHLPAE